MEYWRLIILGVVGLLVVAVLIEAWQKRGKPRSSLADTLGKESKATADDKVPLGMEEIDMDVVRAAERLNTTMERKNTIYRK